MSKDPFWRICWAPARGAAQRGSRKKRRKGRKKETARTWEAFSWGGRIRSIMGGSRLSLLSRGKAGGDYSLEAASPPPRRAAAQRAIPVQVMRPPRERAVR